MLLFEKLGFLPNDFVYNIFEKEFIFSRACFTKAKLFHRVSAEHLCQYQRLSIS